MDVAKRFNNDIGKLALDSIINMTASETGRNLISRGLAGRLISFTLKKDSVLADHACKALANITRSEEKCKEVAEEFIDACSWGDLMNAVSDKSYNEKGLRLEYLAQVGCFVH